ncbi:MAG: DegV family protein [Chloroflexota bacterium]
MSPVGIVTDTTNCLPAELIAEYGIRVASVVLIIGGKPYRDQVDITPTRFWKMFKGLEEMPTTSAVSPGDFAAYFKELGQATDNIACIVVSQPLSGTYDSAIKAKELVQAERPNLNIEVINSKTATGALGFIVLEAARAAKAGKSLAEVVELVNSLIPKVKYLVALDTLKYLIKGGRAPKVAMIGDLLQVKPILTNNNETGSVEPASRARGKRKTMLKLVDMVQNYTDTTKPLHIMVHYTDNREDGEQLKELVTSKYNCAELYMTEYTPVIAAHTGPVLALSFYS